MTITANTATFAVGVAATVAMVAQAAPARADSPVNVAVTDSVRAELVAAAVAMTNGVPASEFSGLQPARTYLAYDPDSQTGCCHYCSGYGPPGQRGDTAASVTTTTSMKSAPPAWGY